MKTMELKKMTKCEECDCEIEGEEIFLIISVPNKDFKTKILAKYCKNCIWKILAEYEKETGERPIEC